MDLNSDQKIAELSQQLERWKKWLARLREQYAELNVELETLNEKFSDVTRERDSLMGDVVKLNARVAELEAKIPKTPQIIIP